MYCPIAVKGRIEILVADFTEHLELVIVQPGSVILVIALPSLRHLVINLSNGLTGQS